MKFVLPLMTGASLICAAALPATAAPLPPADTTTDLGVFTGVPGNDSAGLGRMVPPGTFTDTYTFSTISTDLISASITNSYTFSNQLIDPFTITFYSGVPGNGTQIASATATSPFFGFESGGFAPIRQAAGQFYLVVSGTTKDDPTYGGSVALSVSSVPLPASAPMFGAALLALGAVGYGVKRKKAAAAA
ncbi:FxDxF family PEP-CTERM protein [Lichenifustis flavocetrariae]|uniref:FxDxF family PEP-CTERM protein n=1 Tax=Lichenifustis flavocetrariae TaxID=2949735 RepID=A0AA41ZC55_9HYPH|nr:FxDxF family PEP-CTERM protein [Lichenifustis flavocetrariae]MCW6513182.1 FxDxF family PEP-CTERM protein [Lichenifustis flavocetrariae]